MARGEQLSRQWKIIQSLIAARIGKSAAEIADQLECHPRTVYRDLQALQAAGFPIYTERADGKSLWRMLENARRPAPLPLTLPELMAIHCSRELMKVFAGTPFYDSLESLLHKVQATLPDESRAFLATIEDTFHFGMKPRKNYAAFKEIIQRVGDAAVRKTSIEVLYYTMSRKRESWRKLDPYRVWFFNGTFYLIGFCHLRGEVRVFVLDRIKALQETQEPFELAADFNFDQFVKASFGVFQGDPIRVKVRFSAEVAGYIQENIWHEEQTIHPQADGSVVFAAEVAGVEEIKHWIMGWGANATVLEPQPLRDAIKREVERMLQGYQA